MTKYRTPAGKTHLTPTSFQSHLLPPHFPPPHLLQYPPIPPPPASPPPPSRRGSHHKLLVTHICTLLLMHVVVPTTAQTITGRRSCSRTWSVTWVAGQQIACSARSRMRVESGG